MAQLELLEPEIFREYVAEMLARGDDPARRQAWLQRSAEDVRSDPRFVAHKCGFDSQMILHMASQANNAKLRFMVEGQEVIWEDSGTHAHGDGTLADLPEMGLESD